MSALFGIINKKGRPVEPGDIHAVKEALKHRITDGYGQWHRHHIVLGHCKLNFTPEDPYEQLPLEEDGLVIIADARIDNRQELIRLLHMDPHRAKTTGDASFILTAYRTWGSQCLDRLEGEFVFCIWDRAAGSLFMATDPVGFRPLYYFESEEQLIFCSEIKGILAAKPRPHYFNEAAVAEYFFRNQPCENTYARDVYFLCGGNTLRINGHGERAAIKRYWHPHPAGKYHFTKDSDWQQCFKELLFRAVENRIRTDQPVSVTLSGGIDSGSIACILSVLLARQNKTFHAYSSVLAPDYTGTAQDEQAYIAAVAAHCPNMIRHDVAATDADPFSGVEEAVDLDEQIPNTFFYMDMALLHAAGQNGAGILFNGYGGDHWASWQGHPVLYQLTRKGRWKLALKLLHAFAGNEKMHTIQLLKREYLYRTRLYSFAQKIISGVKGQNASPDPVSIFRPAFLDQFGTGLEKARDPNIIRRNISSLQAGRTGKMLVSFQNRNASFSMQSATPFFDRNIVDFLMDMPPELYISGGHKRSLIRHAMQDVLPPVIQWRKNKLPYSPDFRDRIVRNMEKAERIIANSPDSCFDPYFNKDLVQEGITRLMPRADISNPEIVAGIYLVKALITCVTVNYLKKSGFR